MPVGRIVKALSGFYYVSGEDGTTVECRARGIFKLKGVTPLVGDLVVYNQSKTGEGTIDEVLPRETELIRPPVSNVNTAVLVFSIRDPAINLQLLDKFLVHTENAGLESIVCLTKADLGFEPNDIPSVASKDPLEPEAIADVYRKIGYDVLTTSAHTGEGADELKRMLLGRISVFSGQSGVGKSSLLNALIPGLALATNEISRKLGRGKHTTRHVELIALDEHSFVADTPGFSQLDFAQIESEELSGCFREFRDYASRCRFRGCFHVSEPGCAVAAAAADGSIAKTRYDNYNAFLQEIKERRPRY